VGQIGAALTRLTLDELGQREKRSTQFSLKDSYILDTRNDFAHRAKSELSRKQKS
jgi:hypothetical protein